MKQISVKSFFFIFCLLVIQIASPQIKNNKSQLKESLGNLQNYYNASNNTSLTISDRLKNLDKYLNGVYCYRQDSLIYKGLLQKTWLLGKAQMYDSAIVYSYQLHDLSEKNHDSLYVKKALTKLGIYHKNNNQLIEAFKYHDEAFKLSRKIKDSVSAGNSLLYMANIQKSLGDFIGSKTTAIDGLKYLKNSSELKKLSGLYLNISISYRAQKNYKKALEYNSKALGLRTDSLLIYKIGKNNFLKLKNSRANILADQKKYNESISVLYQLLSDSIVLKSKKEYARVLSNLGHIKWLENRNNTQSDSLLKKALSIREGLNDVQGLIASNIHLTKYYFNIDKEKSLLYAENAYQNAKKRNSMTAILEALGFVFQLKENTNQEAKVYHKVNEKLKRINQSNKEVYAVTKYENEKLSEENSKKESEILKQKNKNIQYSFGITVLIIGIIFVLYFSIQRIRRSQQEAKIKVVETAYEVETQISKTIHDDLGNNVFQVMMQVKNDPTDPIILKKLNEIYDKARDISQEYSGFDIEGEYDIQLYSMLDSFNSDHTRLVLRNFYTVNWQKMSKAIKITLYQVLQELMVNMEKHSEATLVGITFTQQANKLTIAYSDNGIGASKKSMEHKNGLRNTEKRIRAINGTIIFDLEKENGFKVKIQILS